jgi:hypothetical protein
MAITALFRNQPEQPAAAPNRAALKAHLREAAELSRQQQIAVGKSTAARSDVDAAAAAQALVERLRGEIDTLLGNARYEGTELPDVSEQQRAVLAAEKEHARLSIIARAAAAASDRFRADFDTLTAKSRAHQKALPGLLHAAVTEQMQGLAGEFREAEERLRAIHAKVFAHVVLADQLARENGLGVFYNARSFGDLFISRPTHEAFACPPADPWEQKLARDQSGVEVEQQAEQLSRELLRPGD